METVNLFEGDVCTEYVPAIIYGDYSGLADAEEEEVRAWVLQYSGAGFTIGEETQLTTCCISGLLSECVSIEVYIFS